jgi:NAD(P)-dependent dehydrogenase (short-subunit alcohol dehydrogenase family)
LRDGGPAPPTQDVVDEGRKHMNRLAGKVAAITGAGSGIGRATSLVFAEEGASIVAIDIDGERAEETADLVESAGGTAIAFTANVAVEREIAAAIDAAVSRFSKLDILHNNAGVGQPGAGSVPFEDVTEEDWDHVMNVNLKGVFFGCKHAVAPMRANGGGSILITSSISGTGMARRFPVYCISKGAVNTLTKALALELGEHNIRVNAICPSFAGSLNYWLPAGTAVMGKTFAEANAEAAGGWDPEGWPIPLKVGRPPSFRDVAYAAVYLASDEAAYASGVLLTPDDGGLSTASPAQAEGVQAMVDATYETLRATAGDTAG